MCLASPATVLSPWLEKTEAPCLMGGGDVGGVRGGLHTPLTAGKVLAVLVLSFKSSLVFLS